MCCKWREMEDWCSVRLLFCFISRSLYNSLRAQTPRPLCKAPRSMNAWLNSYYKVWKERRKQCIGKKRGRNVCEVGGNFFIRDLFGFQMEIFSFSSISCCQRNFPLSTLHPGNNHHQFMKIHAVYFFWLVQFLWNHLWLSFFFFTLIHHACNYTHPNHQQLDL